MGYKPLPVERARQWGGISVHRNGTIGGEVRVVVHEGYDHEVDAPATAKQLEQELAQLGYSAACVDAGSKAVASVYVSGTLAIPKKEHPAAVTEAAMLAETARLEQAIDEAVAARSTHAMCKELDAASKLGDSAWKETQRYWRLAEEAHQVQMAHWGTPRAEKAKARWEQYTALGKSFAGISREAHSLRAYVREEWHALAREMLKI
jgi:hypothetical protein